MAEGIGVCREGRLLLIVSILLLVGMINFVVPRNASNAAAERSKSETAEEDYKAGTVTARTDYYENFLMDNVLHTTQYGDIHYHIYVPDSYDGSEDYALFISLPGWEGLYFQSVGENLKWEKFA